MKLSLKWLKKYVDIPEDMSPDIIADKLSNCGFEVEEIIETGFNINGVVIGYVKEKKKHPDADKLNLCLVDLGTEVLQIVCGAPNVDAGQKVPVATVGTRLTKDFVIKKSKIRGEVSNGMICSEQELGIGEAHEGIMVLDTDLKIGSSFKELFSDSDIVFDLSITPNRADCLNHVSIARELSIVLETEFRYPNIELPKLKKLSHAAISIDVDEDSSCERFTARLIKGVKVKESPDWLKNYLVAIGLRPINNLVDISNYVMMELGQPLHFYDYDRIKGQRLNIRPAVKGEKVLTLDGKERSLDISTTVIEDAESFACIGGVMGGKESEVNNNTVNVLLESANWTQVKIQRSQRELNLITDASYRYSKGVDYNLPPVAQDRAAQMIAELCEAESMTDLLDWKRKNVEKHKVNFRYSRCHKLLGKEIAEDTIDQIFEKLELRKISSTEWEIPTYRQDLTREIDLIEEVARIIGLNTIDGNKNLNIQYYDDENIEDLFIDELKLKLSSMGLQEVITNSMVKENHLKDFLKEDAVQIENPLSDEMETMRSSLVPSLLKVVDHNFKHRQQSMGIFEINKDYKHLSEKIREEKKLVIVLSGYRNKKHWSNQLEKYDFYDIKGLAETILSDLEIKFKFKNCDKPVCSSHSLGIYIGKDEIGFIGELSRSFTKKMKFDYHAFVLELSVSKLFKYRPKSLKKIQDINKYPVIERDVAVLCKKKTASEDMIKSIRKTCGNLLQFVDVFDIYSDKSFDKDKHSIAFKMIFADNRTLTDEEVDPLFNKVIENLAKEFDAHLREA